MSLLRIEHLHRSFGSIVVTDDVSLAIAPGERHVIIGPNGAGKTSLLNQLGGQLRPTAGRIYFKDVDITGWRPDSILRGGIARTFQKNNLFQNLTALENVRLAVQARRGNALDCITPAQRVRPVLERAREILGLVGLDGAAAQATRMLSYGQQRQLEVGVALAGEPQLLLLDEPTSGMSPAETEHMIGLLGRLPRDLAILMIEHDMDVVFSLADRITVLHYGKILATGTPADIQADANVRQVYLGAAH